jgi:drug/metabolite transporter (DMT)-like permease
MHTLIHLAAVHPDVLHRALGLPDSLYDRLSHRLNLYRTYVPLSVVVFALAASTFYAISSVLQQQAASRQPATGALNLRLLGALLRDPRWWLGILADVGAFAFQFLALRRGSLALVAPLMVVGLVFALPASAVMARRRLTRREWIATLLVVVGLSLFLTAAQPGPGNPQASTVGWVILGVVTAVVVATCIAVGGRSPRRRALSLGAAAGMTIGVTSALTEVCGHLLDHGLAATLSSWPPYVLAATTVVALQLNQAAFQAGELKWSLPLLTVVEPLSAIAIGQLLFGEHIASTSWAIAGEVIGMVAVIAGVFGLAGQPSTQAEPPAGAPGTRERPAAPVPAR